MSEFIDGYTAARIKSFWAIDNLSTASPFAIQKCADTVYKDLEDAAKELSLLKAEKERLEKEVENQKKLKTLLYSQMVNHIEFLEKQLAVAVEAMDKACQIYVSGAKGGEHTMVVLLDRALATIKAMQAGGEKE